jgi:hypothetical protein
MTQVPDPRWWSTRPVMAEYECPMCGKRLWDELQPECRDHGVLMIPVGRS